MERAEEEGHEFVVCLVVGWLLVELAFAFGRIGVCWSRIVSGECVVGHVDFNISIFGFCWKQDHRLESYF